LESLEKALVKAGAKNALDVNYVLEEDLDEMGLPDDPGLEKDTLVV
jgi:hypothetical protein